jgi:nucleotide-binding universal stress UspA family protein
LLDHVLVAVASDEDARQTCRVVLETVGSQLGSVTVVTVIPRYRQWSDSLPSDYRLENAYATLHVACGLLEDAGIDVEVSIEQSSNTSRAIHELAERIDASAIIFTPRSANRLMDFLAGDTTWSLVKKSSRPVLVLPLA